MSDVAALKPGDLLNVDRILGDKEYRDELRHRCRTDHAFLAPLLGYHKFHPVIHRPVWDFYVQKKPGLSIEDQDPIKNRMHLDPRETFKTTAGIVDSTQWIINFPDVTILNEGATQPLANAITNVISAHLTKRKGAQPTPFQALFEEWVIEKAQHGCYTAPCRTYVQVDQTVDSTSVGTSQSGFHPWILNPDDMVDTNNSGINAKAETRQAVINSHNTNINTLRRGGYQHMRGTRYHPFDLYGHTLRTMIPGEWKVFIRSAMRLTNGKRLMPGEFPSESEVELLLPGLVTYAEVRRKFTADYESFMCQQMNDPQGGGLQIITEDLYRSCLIAAEKVPAIGEVHIFWRPSYAGKKYMQQWAEGAAARIVAGKVYIIDAWRGMYTPSSQAEKIVEICKRHQTGRLAIEQVPGWEFIQAQVMNEAARRNRSIRIDWEPFVEDDTVRDARMKQIEPMLHSGRLQFSLGSGQRPEMERQCCYVGMIEDNGILDSISRIALRIPASVIQEELEREDIHAYRRAKNREMYDFVFQHGGINVVEQAEEQMQTYTPPSGYPGLPDILGGLDG